jgi:hypothetical protein
VILDRPRYDFCQILRLRHLAHVTLPTLAVWFW